MADLADTSFSGRALHRRTFLRVAGATAASSALVLAGCGKDDDPTVTDVGTGTLVFAANDTGILNLTYLLAQISASFYQKVVTTPPADFTAADTAACVDMRDHEVIYRELYKSVLGPNPQTGAYDNGLATALEFNFTPYTLTTRAGVYAAARTLEDIGVGAYNGLGRRLRNGSYLRLLLKITSVKARHAAFVRDQAEPDSFAGSDVITQTGNQAGLDTIKTPVEVAKSLASLVPVVLVADNLMLL
ncbi:ferritin-like domain-containing protein [Hymenobacter psychrophilus]|uniref:Ferritin-like domain-containing protein n=1 Tax=Hymenobacter psychrophilus TaxID=651662 RepID=A0A1H3MCE5_9BACT|nr:ferritin-like domain-containing protein [Hymenobacter psychrophilus]SDY73968.1 Ferritin-like domain-containing protein [Hymenobacter psychrophilus]